MMNMYYKLPRFVYLKNRKYFINTDYRIFIELEKKVRDEDDKNVYYSTLVRFYPAFFEIVENNLLKEAVDKFLWFYACGKKVNTEDEIEKSSKTNSQSSQRVYDYDYDGDLIYGAFYERYKIDLSTARLHWWQFKALFNSLSAETQFKKVIGYRCYDGKDKDMLELKRLHQLPLSKGEIDEKARQNRIYDNLREIALKNKEKR